MIFHPDLAEKVLSGEKTVTRRPIRTRSYEVGKTYAVQLGRGKPEIGRIRILGAWEETLDEIVGTPNDAAKEGFSTVWDFFQRWEQIYGRVDFDEIVWRLEFELVR